CRILILSKLLGRVNYFDEQKTRDLLALKKRLGYDDVRFRNENCEVCGPSSFGESYSDFLPEPYAFQADCAPAIGPCRAGADGGANGSLPAGADMERLVRTITDQVMAALAGAGV